MTGPTFHNPTPTEAADYLTWLETKTPPRACLCPAPDHPHPADGCVEPVRVAVKIHMVGECQAARAQRPDLIDVEGDGTQLLCIGCWWLVLSHIKTQVDRVTAAAFMMQALNPGPPKCVCGKPIYLVEHIARVIEEF